LSRDDLKYQGGRGQDEKKSKNGEKGKRGVGKEGMGNGVEIPLVASYYGNLIFHK